MARVERREKDEKVTAFFIKSIKTRQTAAFMETLRTEQREVVEQQDKLDAAVRFYSALFRASERDVSEGDRLVAQLWRKVKSGKQEALGKDIVREEVREAVFALQNGKTPGRDGIFSFLWGGRAEGGMPRDGFGRAVLLGALKLEVAEVLERSHEVTFSSKEVYQRVWSECRRLATVNPVGLFETCHRCGEMGHLIRSCTKAGPVPTGPERQEERPEKGERHMEVREEEQPPAKPMPEKGPARQGEHPKEGRKWCEGVRGEKRLPVKARGKTCGREKANGSGGSVAPGKAAEGFYFMMEGVPQSFAFEKEKMGVLTTVAMEALTNGRGTEEVQRKVTPGGSKRACLEENALMAAKAQKLFMQGRTIIRAMRSGTNGKGAEPPPTVEEKGKAEEHPGGQAKVEGGSNLPRRRLGTAGLQASKRRSQRGQGRPAESGWRTQVGWCLRYGHMAKDCTASIVCSLCGEEGHVARDCKKEKSCHICGSTDHLFRNCPDRKRSFAEAVVSGRPPPGGVEKGVQQKLRVPGPEPAQVSQPAGETSASGGKVQAKALEGVVEKLMESLAPTEFGGEEKAAEGIAPVIPVAEEGEASLEAGGEAAARPELELLVAAVERAEALMMGGESETVKRAAATTAMAEVTVTEKEEAGESPPGFSVQKRSFVEDWAGMMEEELPLDMGVVGEIFPSKKVKVGTPSLSDSEGSVGGGSGVSLEWESASPVLQSAYDVVSFSPGSPNEVPYLGDFEVEGPLSEPGV
ncbi:hypothetical protein SKAU_G00239090 [Synaphobranchus kaupii]|uniref:CCHC-type domain-containing protein n=1 Tax=Synaphobranchus kaupii TaxID=118154 RepID=A0A9Q1IS16_SYNKA|nr:hypothetical protein SKAU_G00239090 [Synaphobranchus kaupii]